MSSSQNPYARAHEVAYEHNAELPGDLKQAILVEQVHRIERALQAGRHPHRTILLVGGAGYIGTVLGRLLLSLGYRLRVADALLYQNHQLGLFFSQPPQSQFFHVDVRDSGKIAELLDGVTDVVLLAALVGDPISKRYPEETWQINEQAAIKLLASCRGKVERFVFVSTCSNYGLQADASPAREDAELNPLSVYAKTKVAVERHILQHRSSLDLHPVILRFATAFGLSPRMRFDLTVSQFTRQMFLLQELLVYDADTWRPYCHVLDLADAIRRVLQFPVESVSGEVFNTGGDAGNHTKRSIVDTIHQYLPEAPVRYQERGPDPRNYRVDFSKIKHVLHFTPTHTVENGVGELLDHLRQGVFEDVEEFPRFYGNVDIPKLSGRSPQNRRSVG